MDVITDLCLIVNVALGLMKVGLQMYEASDATHDLIIMIL